MHGDPGRLRQDAQALRDTAAETRALAAAVRDARSVTWQSVAAEEYRGHLERCAAGVDRAAEGIAVLADGVDAHATAVASALAGIAEAERWVRSVVAAVGDGVSDAGGIAAAGARALTEVLPAPGDPRWLVLAAELGR